MYYRRRRNTSNKWKYALYTFIAGAAVAVLVFCGTSLKKELEAAQAVQGQLDKNHDSYYISDNSSSQETETSGAVPSNSPQVTPSPTPAADKYLVTVYEGKIVVYRNDETLPMKTLSMPLSMLTPEDIEILEKGISVTGIGQLKQVLEDYE